MNRVEARPEKIGREKMMETGQFEAIRQETLSSSRTSESRERQRKQVQEEGTHLKRELSASRRARKHHHHSSKDKNKQLPSSSRKHDDRSYEEGLAISAEEMVRQKWTKARREQYFQSLAAAQAQSDEDVPSEDESYDTDATPRRKATRESSSESERGHYDSDSSLDSFDGRVQDLTGVKKPSEENRPPTDLDFAKGLEKGARKLKLIAKDQEEAVGRKKVDYDHLRDLLEGYAKDPKSADHDRLNELLAAMGSDEHSEENISESEGNDSSASLAMWNASIKGLLRDNRTYDFTESASLGNGDTSMSELKRDILDACGAAAEHVDFVSVPRTSAMPRKGATPREANNRSLASQGGSGRSQSSQDKSLTNETTSGQGDANVSNGVDNLKRDILQTCGAEENDFVAVPRKSAMPRTRSIRIRKSDAEPGAETNAVTPSRANDPITSSKDQLSIPGDEVPNDDTNETAMELKRAVLEAYRSEDNIDFVSVPRKSAMPRNGTKAEQQPRPLRSSVVPPSHPLVGETSQPMPIPANKGFPVPANTGTDVRQPRSEESLVVENQATPDLKRDVLEAYGVEENVDFVAVPRMSAMPRTENLVDSKPRPVHRSNSKDSPLPLTKSDRRPNAGNDVPDDSQASMELKRDILEACGAEDNVDFVSVPRKSAMPRRGTLVESKSRPVQRSNSKDSPLQPRKGDRSQSPDNEVGTENLASMELKRDILEACGVEENVDFVDVPRKSAMPRKATVADSKPKDGSREFSVAALKSSSSFEQSEMERRRSEEAEDAVFAAFLHQQEQENLAASNRARSGSIPPVPPNRTQTNKQETIQLLMADGDGVKVEEFVVVPLKPPTLSMRTGAKPTLSGPRSKVLPRKPEAIQEREPTPPKVSGGSPILSNHPTDTAGQGVAASPPRSKVRGRNRNVPRHKKELNNALCPDSYLEVNRKPAAPTASRRTIMRGLKEEKKRKQNCYRCPFVGCYPTVHLPAAPPAQGRYQERRTLSWINVLFQYYFGCR